MKYNKLVRDKIPQILDAKGITYEQRVAGDKEYLSELIKKLEEESQEFKESGEPEELADVLEVIDCLLKLPKYSNVYDIKTQKREERGGFDDRIILKGEK